MLKLTLASTGRVILRFRPQDLLIHVDLDLTSDKVVAYFAHFYRAINHFRVPFVEEGHIRLQVFVKYFTVAESLQTLATLLHNVLELLSSVHVQVPIYFTRSRLVEFSLIISNCL